MLGKGNRYIQVKVSTLSYEYIKKYCSMFNVSISQFCSDAVTQRIIDNGALKQVDVNKQAAFIKATYEE